MRDSDWKILSTLYQNKNITKKANLFFLSQPTLTKRIQKMEEELGAQLLLRHTKGITFTPKGELAVKYANQILQLTQELKTHLNDTPQPQPATIRIGISLSIANYVIPGFFTEFSKKFPHLHADIADHISEYTIDLIIQNKLDFGFICSQVYSSQISKHLLRTEPCYVVSKTPVDLASLPEIPCVVSNHNKHSQQVMQNWWDEHYADPPTFCFKAHNGELALQIIKKSLCYSLMFYRGKHFFENHGLCATPIYYMDGSPVSRNCYLIYNRQREQEPMIQNFLHEIRMWDFSLM